LTTGGLCSAKLTSGSGDEPETFGFRQ
jgi:hypothetical protein